MRRLSGSCLDDDGSTPPNLDSPICDYSNHVIGAYQCPAPSTCVKGPSAPANVSAFYLVSWSTFPTQSVIAFMEGFDLSQ